MKKTRLEKWMESKVCSPVFAYLGAFVILTRFLSAVMVFGTNVEHLPTWLGIVTASATLVASSQLVLSFINWFSAFPTTSETPAENGLYERDSRRSRYAGCRACMLISEKQIEKLCDSLEVHYLANRDKRLKFCLLTDFTDADTETTHEDAALVDRLTRLINELNGKHARDGKGPFLALNRPRRWNASERKWIGYERKRGKLEELNQF